MTTFLTAADPDYADASTGYNLSVQHRPAVVVRATSTDDVVTAVRYATEHGLGVGVLATGHGPSRPADGMVLINTAGMDGIAIDPVARTARVEAGVRGGALVRRAAEHGLAPLNGSSPEVGVIAYHLGGGVGILGRSLGWAVDHVRALDVVTADGELRHVTVTENPELFWALRGGGKGTLGVVVAIEIGLHPVTRLYGGGMYFPAEQVRQVLSTYASWTGEVPETMGSSVLLIQLPDFPGVPEPLRGRYVAHVRFAFTGSAEDGERLVRPFRELSPLIDSVAEMPYAQVGTIHAEPTTPVAFHARNSMLRILDDGAIDRLLEHAGPDSGAAYLVELRHLGGAFARPGATPCALGRRDGEFILYTGGAGDVDELVPAFEAVHAALQPWATGGVCVNFLSGPDVGPELLARGYLDGDAKRLADVKRAVDPHDVFRVHHGRAGSA